jgi:hypothetical protein
MESKIDTAAPTGGSSLLWPVLLCALCLPAHARDATALRAQHAALREQLASNPFRRPLHLESSESSGELKGEVYAVLEQRYALVGPALQDVDRWCDILILHLNVKQCRAATSKAGDSLSLSVGRKFDQPLADAYPFEFTHEVVMTGPDYVHVVLNAEEGPMGTSRYRIQVEAVGLDGGRSFLHLSYSFASGWTARMAMQIYLATLGRDKVGFSIIANEADGKPVYIRSLRGMVERNSMRCYLTIEAYLGALSAPASEQLELRLNDWYTAVERYPVQLHEMERGEYLDMKHREIQRQRLPGSAAAAP